MIPETPTRCPSVPPPTKPRLTVDEPPDALIMVLALEYLERLETWSKLWSTCK